MLAVKMPAHEVFVLFDYSRDLGDNLDVLMNKLLEKYPQRFAEDSEQTKSSVARVTVCISVRIANVRYKKSNIPKGK